MAALQMRCPLVSPGKQRAASETRRTHGEGQQLSTSQLGASRRWLLKPKDVGDVALIAAALPPSVRDSTSCS